jgi:hypothetical protein
MLSVTLQRRLDAGLYTAGRLLWEGQPQAIHTLEEPWRNNARRISCIPTGQYKCVPWGWGKNSQSHFKRCWLLEGVQNRSAILIHAGNTLADTEGCILVGLSTQGSSLINSQMAMKVLREAIGNTQFMLNVASAPMVKAEAALYGGAIA